MPFDGAANFTEYDIRRSGNVKLIEVKTEGMPKEYLNLTPDSDGHDLDAGINKAKDTK